MTTPLWTPLEARASQTTLHAFSSWLSSRTGKSLIGYDELHKFSIDDPATFWSALWDFTKISGDKGEPPFLVDGDKMPGAQFFPGAKLNFAENVLRRTGPGTAVVFWGEDKVKRRLSWDELHASVGKASRAFGAAGVAIGDRVAAILPNMPESIVSVLGAAADRRRVVLLLARLRRPGRARPLRPDRAQGARSPATATTTTARSSTSPTSWPRSSPSFPPSARSSSCPYLGRAQETVQGLNAGLIHSGRRAQTWDDAVLALPAAPPTFERLPFSHPALRAVLLGHDRHAQVHRALGGRHAAEAS